MNSLEDYGTLFERLGLTELEVQDGEFKLKLKKEGVGYVDNALRTSDAANMIGNTGTTGMIMHDVMIKSASGSAENAGNLIPVRENQKEPETGEAIKAPLLGIFYAVSGDKKAVKEGDSVEEGDVLCTIEAMKMMNEVKATRSGIIKKICAKDGDLVEYNQELFIVA